MSGRTRAETRGRSVCLNSGFHRLTGRRRVSGDAWAANASAEKQRAVNLLTLLTKATEATESIWEAVAKSGRHDLLS